MRITMCGKKNMKAKKPGHTHQLGGDRRQTPGTMSRFHPLNRSASSKPKNLPKNWCVKRNHTFSMNLPAGNTSFLNQTGFLRIRHSCVRRATLYVILSFFDEHHVCVFTFSLIIYSFPYTGQLPWHIPMWMVSIGSGLSFWYPFQKVRLPHRFFKKI